MLMMYLCIRPLSLTPTAKAGRCGSSLAFVQGPRTAPNCPVHGQPMERIFPTEPVKAT